MELSQLFFPEYTHTIRKRDVAGVLVYLHFWFTVWPWASHSSLLCLCFRICITEIVITFSASHGSSEAYLVLSMHNAWQNSGIILTNMSIWNDCWEQQVQNQFSQQFLGLPSQSQASIWGKKFFRSFITNERQYQSPRVALASKG